MIGAEILTGKESEMKLKETGIGLRIEVVIVQRIEEESQVSSQVPFCPDVTLGASTFLFKILYNFKYSYNTFLIIYVIFNLNAGHSEKSRHHSSRGMYFNFSYEVHLFYLDLNGSPLIWDHSAFSDRDYHSSSYSSREKDRHRHHSYA